MVDFVMTAHAPEEGSEVELFREILHAVIEVRGQHHLKFLRVYLTVLVHHKVRSTGGFKVETVVRAISVSETEEVSEFVGALLLERVTVAVLADTCDAGMFSGPVECECFRLE